MPEGEGDQVRSLPGVRTLLRVQASGHRVGRGRKRSAVSAWFLYYAAVATRWVSHRYYLRRIDLANGASNVGVKLYSQASRLYRLYSQVEYLRGVKARPWRTFS